MRSVPKKIGIVLVAVLSLGLSACAPQPEEASDVASIACESVAADVSATTDSLESSKASLKDVSGTPAETSAKADITAAQVRLTALDKRSLECADEAVVKPAANADEVCAGSWLMATSDYANNRWFSAGIAEIRDAKTAKEATDAAFVWLEKVRKDPNLLAGAASYFFDQDVDKTTLVDGNNCATEKAVELTIQLDLTLADAKSITPEDAPANGYNSGVNDGEVIAEGEPGIGGDRTAIKIVTKDGNVIWIMARCGNIVTEGKPPVPPGITDNPKKPEQDPYPRGNAPIGGGTNADPGPGTYIPPQQMEQPTAQPRVDPAPPAPEPAPAPPVVVPSPAPAVPPTVNTGEQTNNGTVPEQGGANCNPDFQNCP